VLWLAVADEPFGTLATLAAEVTAALRDAGHDLDERRLRAHLTFARRARAPVDAAVVAAVRAALPVAPPAATRWRSEPVEVWRSRLGRGPARYEVVASLGAAG
jgi:2'-5' RNA ligase